MRNRTSDLWILRTDALSLSHRDSTVSEVYYEVHMTQVLHTARISNVDSVMFANRIREMVSFELGKEIEKGDICECFLKNCTFTAEYGLKQLYASNNFQNN